MLLANSTNGSRIQASPDSIATCPMCSEPLLAKCGQVVVWHWSHRANPECDDWHAVETKWHREWKMRFPEDCQEIILERGGKKHRADVQIASEMVIEFQNAPISITDVRARETFYGRRMAWVFNCTGAWDSDRLRIFDRGEFHSFLWVHPRRTPQRCSRPIFFDLGLGQILDVRRIYGDGRTTGWGYLRSYGEFIDGMTLRNPRGWTDILYRGVEHKLEWLDRSDGEGLELLS